MESVGELGLGRTDLPVPGVRALVRHWQSPHSIFDPGRTGLQADSVDHRN